MDFFASQNLAKSRTQWLIFYFGAALVLMTLGIYLVVAFIASVIGSYQGQATSLWHPELLLIVIAANCAVVGGASLIKIIELRRGGGASVAASLGGRRVDPNTTDPKERVLINVVEEMALASGIAVPPVYLLDREEGINAFAAGYTPADAVVAVNRGTINRLNRDELQGVIAHEFSHILNGDMRLSIRLIGILAGIQLLAMIGYFCLRIAGNSRIQSSSNHRTNNQGFPVVLVFGLGILAIGSIGQFFARLIKASISRQREFLADASAVQFTRYPEGLAGALKMIGASQAGSIIHDKQAEMVSHLFFASCFNRISALFATHPPLVVRIKKIDPLFDGNFKDYLNHRAQREAIEERQTDAAASSGSSVKPTGSTTAGGKFFPIGWNDRFPLNPGVLITTIGAPKPAHIERSKEIISSFPAEIYDAAHDPFLARSLSFVMLLSEKAETKAKQLKIIHENEGLPTKIETEKLHAHYQVLTPLHRLPLLEMLQATLVGLSDLQYDRFRTTIEKLVAADDEFDLFEFVVRHYLISHLERHFHPSGSPGPEIHDLGKIWAETQILLSEIARAGALDDDEDHALAAFQTAIARFPRRSSLEDAQYYKQNLHQLEEALMRLERASLPLKERILQAAVAAISKDGQITVAEAELFRAIGESIHCPMPPLTAQVVLPN